MALVGEGLSGRKGPGVSPGTAERCSFLSGNLGYEISLSDVNLKNSCVIPVGEAYLSPCQALGALMLRPSREDESSENFPVSFLHQALTLMLLTTLGSKADGIIPGKDGELRKHPLKLV